MTGRGALARAAAALFLAVSLASCALTPEKATEALFDYVGTRDPNPDRDRAFDIEVDIGSLVRAMGADPNARNEDGLTPLHIAVRRETPLVIESLIRHGARTDIKDRAGDTPLHRAVVYSSPGVVWSLLRVSADVHALDEDGLTPLELALREGVIPLLKRAEAVTYPCYPCPW